MSGNLILSEPTLGDLDLSACASGYVTISFDLGSAAVREATRDRALGHGEFDDSRFLGPRSFAVTVVVDQRHGDATALFDRVAAYNNPRRRPYVTWTEPGSTQPRQCRDMVGRGFPRPIDSPKYHSSTFTWRVPDGKVVDPVLQTFQIVPSSDTELGRSYPENYADGGRGPYPASAGLGGRLVTNAGGLEADWVCQLFGPCVNPWVSVNGIKVALNLGGGATLVAGQYVAIDSFARTILLNGDPTLSRFNKSNYTQWSWQSLGIPGPGTTTVRVGADSGTVSALFSFRSTWQ
jgi:hypothetical protein